MVRVVCEETSIGLHCIGGLALVCVVFKGFSIDFEGFTTGLYYICGVMLVCVSRGRTCDLPVSLSHSCYPFLRNTQLPVAEPTEEFPVAAALSNEHKVPRGDVCLVQGHEPLVVQCSQHLILLQHTPPALCCIWHDLGNECPACSVLPAGSHNTKAASVCVGGRTQTQGGHYHCESGNGK